MTIKKTFISLALLSTSFVASANVEHHNLSISECRALPSGAIQITGNSSLNNQKLALIFSMPEFTEKIIDRYLSLCLTSFASGSVLRVDYLECSSNTCTAQPGTSVQIIK